MCLRGGPGDVLTEAHSLARGLGAQVYVLSAKKLLKNPMELSSRKIATIFSTTGAGAWEGGGEGASVTGGTY